MQELSQFVIVSVPTALAVAESMRLVQSLHDEEVQSCFLAFCVGITFRTKKKLAHYGIKERTPLPTPLSLMW